LHKFCEKKLQIFCKQPVKGNLHIFSFSWLKIRLFKILQNFCIFEMALSRAFQKCIIFHFGQIFFCKHFYYITGFCDKKFNFFKFIFRIQPSLSDNKYKFNLWLIFAPSEEDNGQYFRFTIILNILFDRKQSIKFINDGCRPRTEIHKINIKYFGIQ